MRKHSSPGSTGTTALYWMLLGSVFFSVAGMAVLLMAPQTASRFGPLLPWFMKGPTWVYMVTVPLLVLLIYGRDLSWRTRIAAVAIGGGVGLTAELIGTNTGFPFGPYSYTDFLAPKILGDVPYLIPLSWYATSVLAWDLASRLEMKRTARIGVGAAFMVLWDLALDPAMVAAFPVWQWHVDGFFHGMPFQNLVGWFFTSVVILGAYDTIIGAIKPAARSWTYRIWLASAALPIGMAAVRGMWVAVSVGTVAVAVPMVMVALKERARVSVLPAAQHAT